MSNVKPLHPYLRAPVDCCHNCPLAFLRSMAPYGGDQDWICNATPDKRALGGQRSTDSAPEWCPLKVQPIVVHWESPRRVERKLGGEEPDHG